MTEPELLSRIAKALERLAPPSAPQTDWQAHPAYVWALSSARAVPHLEAPALDLLRGIDDQKARIVTNVERLAAGHAAHDMLLWGSRGMGKSAVLRAAVRAAQDAGSAAVAAELLSIAGGATQFSVRVPDHSTGCAYGKLFNVFKHELGVTLLGYTAGIGAEPRLNPPDSDRVAANATLYYIADRRIDPASINWGACAP